LSCILTALIVDLRVASITRDDRRLFTSYGKFPTVSMQPLERHVFDLCAGATGSWPRRSWGCSCLE
jgi:hypothetical protein